MMTRTALCIALLCLNVASYAQTEKQKAKELGEKAVKLEDEGKYDEALPLLLEAQKIDKSNTGYQYEMAYCYREKKDYSKAASLMEEIITAPDVRQESFQMLGNIYDQAGDSTKALKTYAEGLKKFPKAGRLYLESGNVYLIRQQYEKALSFYEKGIDVDPAYPSNYYRAAQLYSESSEPLWAMVYGEMFMNLERNSDRTAQMSKILYDTYKSKIVIRSPDSMEVHFSNNVISADDKSLKKGFQLPFSMIYEPLMAMSLVGTTEINTESLCDIRANFIKAYYEQHHEKEYPSSIFAYQHKVAKAGHMSAYSHWILMKGDEEAFTRWQSKHKEEWDSFATWFADNKLKID